MAYITQLKHKKMKRVLLLWQHNAITFGLSRSSKYHLTWAIIISDHF